MGTAGVQVGNQYHNYWGRRDDANALDAAALQDETRRMSMNPTTQQLELVQYSSIGTSWQAETRDITVLPIGLNDSGFARDLGVSDPLNGYFNLTDPAGGFAIDVEAVEDGYKFTESSTGSALDYAFDTPVDQLIDSSHYNDYLQNTGIKVGYRVVHLQRLANPTRPFNAITNPYLTIDSSSLDLFVFNGVETTSDPNNTPETQRLEPTNGGPSRTCLIRLLRHPKSPAIGIAFCFAKTNWDT